MSLFELELKSPSIPLLQRGTLQRWEVVRSQSFSLSFEIACFPGSPLWKRGLGEIFEHRFHERVGAR